MPKPRGLVLVCARWVLPGIQMALVSLLVCPPATAEVKTRVRADGTIEIYNDGPGASLRPRTLQLRAVPRAEWSDWIREHAERHGVDPRLVQSIVQVESGYNHRAKSRAGAVGLMQLMPGTARTLQVGDRYDAEQNIRGGVAYLRQMIDLFPGRLELAIAAYNAGPNAVQRHGAIPPYAETRDYVDRVLTLYRGGGGSSLMVGFSSGGNALQLNGLAQPLMPSPLQQALASGTLRPAAKAVPVPQVTIAAPVTTVARTTPAPAAPAVVPAVMPAAGPAPGFVPASLPVAAEPAVMQPATGG